MATAPTGSPALPSCHACAPDPVLSVLLPPVRVAPGPRRPVPRLHLNAAAGRADLLVVGRVVTMDPTQPEAEALAVRGGHVVAIGSRGDLEALRGPGTEVLETGDGVAFPGFVEPHMHLWSTVIFDDFTDCSPFANRSFDDVVERLRRVAGSTPPGTWVRGKLFDPSQYAGEPVLDRDLLDRVVPDHPAVVVNASQHFAYANSRALDAGGLTDDTPDPPGGFLGRRDGRLDGVLAEAAAMRPVLMAMPVPTQDELLEGIVTILRRAARAGVTKIHEAATGVLLGAAELDLLHHLAAEGRLPVRVTTAQWNDSRPSFEKAGVRPHAGDDWVRAVSWKVVSDGSNQGRTGFLREPYLETGGRGEANLSAEELAEVIRYGHGHGWQVMVHANGDAAIDRAIDAYEEALAGMEPHDRRHRIEHCSLADDAALARMARLDLSPSFLMNHVYWWGDVFRTHILGAERAGRLDSVATALRHGLRPSLHSDHSVTPIEPLRSVQTAVTRLTWRDGKVLNADECVPVDAALRAVTIDAAWQTHSDDVLGSLEVGKLADLVVLGADPRAVDPDGIAELPVLETRLAGRSV